MEGRIKNFEHTLREYSQVGLGESPQRLQAVDTFIGEICHTLGISREHLPTYTKQDLQRILTERGISCTPEDLRTISKSLFLSSGQQFTLAHELFPWEDMSNRVLNALNFAGITDLSELRDITLEGLQELTRPVFIAGRNLENLRELLDDAGIPHALVQHVPESLISARKKGH